MNRVNFRGLAEMIDGMPVPQPAQPKRETTRSAWGTSAAAPAAPPATPAPDLGCFRVTIDDVDAVREIDPLLTNGALILLAAPLMIEPTAIRRPEGRALFTIAQVDPEAGAVCASGDVVDAIYQGIGAEPTTTPRADHVEAGRAWAPSALRVIPHHDLGVWRREPDGLRMLVADRLANSFALPLAEVERLAGAPAPSRTLWRGEDAERLDAVRRAREEKAEQARAAAAAAVQVEIRDRTFGELRITAVAVRIGRLADGLVSARASAPSHMWRTAEPWPGARVLFATDDEVYWGFLNVAGVTMPRFSRDGVRSVDPGTIAPRSMAEVAEADGQALLFMADRKREEGEDFGAVRRLQSEVFPAAQAFIERWAPLLLSPSPTHAHMLTLFAEQVVRIAEIALRPDAALRAIGPILDARFRALRPAIAIPVGAIVRNIQTGEVAARPRREIPRFSDDELPSKSAVQWLGAALVRATQRGDFVPAGATLEPAPWEEPAAKKTKATK